MSVCICGHNGLPVPGPCPHWLCGVHSLPGTSVALGCCPGEGEAGSPAFPRGQLLRMSVSLHLSSHAHTPLSFSVCHLMPTERAQCYLFQRGSEDENQEWAGAQSWEVLLEGGPGLGTPGLGESKSRGSRAALVSGDLLFPLLTFWLLPSSGESSRLWFQTVRVYPLAEWRDNEHRSLIG